MTFHKVPTMSVSRHRILSDGDGVVSLVALYGCTLHCRYCINDECHDESSISQWFTPQELFDKLMSDDLYFRATGGGVTFGGGEPLLYSDFISEFAKICKGRWKINVETSLNVPLASVQKVMTQIDHFFVDIKDMNPSIYNSYTGHSNEMVCSNLKLMIDNGLEGKITVRIPKIKEYNTKADIDSSVKKIKAQGLSYIDVFDYSINKQEVYSRTSSKHGKVVCEVLKRVRQLIADANAIPYETVQCNVVENCVGTCPKCEQELKYLSEKIWEKEKKSINVKL